LVKGRSGRVSAAFVPARSGPAMLRRMKASIEAPATHYRLEPETWELAIEEYRNGASAKDVAAKWKVAPSSVYRQAALMGAGKRAVGDARARAHARMVEEEEAATRALNPVGSRALKGLFTPERESEPDAADPKVLMRLATLASGRAMTGRLWAEAKALASLAESYARLNTHVEREALTVETLPLALVAEIAGNPEAGAVMRRMSLATHSERDPDHAARLQFWALRQPWIRRTMKDKDDQYYLGRKHGQAVAERERGGA